MYSAFCKPLAAILLLTASSSAAPYKLTPRQNTVLIYENQAREFKSRLVVRVARYGPDIVMEWENTNDQGTIHLFRKAVESGSSFTLRGHYQVGVDVESPDTSTIWLPRSIHSKLMEKGKAKFKRNRLPVDLRKIEDGTRTLQHNERKVEIEVFTAQDSRGDKWTFSADPENPILVGFESRYFKQRLVSFSTPKRDTLRWIRKLPPVK